MRISKTNFFLITFFCWAGAVCARQTEEPEKVYRTYYILKPQEWYQKQAELWQEQVQRTPEDTEAWRNYYLASDYAGGGGELAKKILEEMSGHVADSYEFLYLKARNSWGAEKQKLVEKAHARNPDGRDVWYSLLHLNKINNNLAEARRFAEKIYLSDDISPALYDYNFNMLNGLEENAVLFTFGDADTYPAWILQDAKEVRPDVTVINLHLACAYPDYFQRLLDEKSITLEAKAFSKLERKDVISNFAVEIAQKHPEQTLYIASTANLDLADAIRENLYLVGLAYRFSKEKFDVIPNISQNLSNARLDYLTSPLGYEHHVMQETLMPSLNANYISPITTLARHFKENGNSSAYQRWKNLALKIALASGNANYLQYVREL